MSTQLKKLLEDICGIRAPGPLPTFTVLHVVKALEVIARDGSVGRFRLSQELGVGEGVVRTLLKRMKDAGIVRSARSGCILTQNGVKLWEELRSKLARKVELGRSEISLGEYNVAILVKGSGSKVSAGLEQRDAAVKAGALGAVTIVMREGKLQIPMISDDASKDFPRVYQQVVKALQPQEGDVIVVGSANEKLAAEYGALAAAWTLL